MAKNSPDAINEDAPGHVKITLGRWLAMYKNDEAVADLVGVKARTVGFWRREQWCPDVPKLRTLYDYSGGQIDLHRTILETRRD